MSNSFGQELRARDVDTLVHVVGDLRLAVGGGQVKNVIDSVRSRPDRFRVVALAAHPFEVSVIEAGKFRRSTRHRPHATAALAKLPYEHFARKPRCARDEDETARV